MCVSVLCEVFRILCVFCRRDLRGEGRSVGDILGDFDVMEEVRGNEKELSCCWSVVVCLSLSLSFFLLHKIVRLVRVFLEAFRLLLHALLDLEDGRRFGGVLRINRVWVFWVFGKTLRLRCLLFVFIFFFDSKRIFFSLFSFGRMAVNSAVNSIHSVIVLFYLDLDTDIFHFRFVRIDSLRQDEYIHTTRESSIGGLW